MQEEQYYIGSDLKFKVDITASGFDQDTDEYRIDLYCGSKKISFTNEDVVVEDGNHYLLVNTDLLKPGPLMLVVTAIVPDETFPSGARREVEVVKNIGYIKGIK